MTQQSQSDISLAVKALKIGGKVRELRQKNRFTLQDLAVKTGLSKPFLSQIENDHVIPPVATLLRLSRALHVGLAYFFQDESGDDKVSITRKYERVKMERRPHHDKGDATCTYESLETRKTGKHMEPFLVEFHAMDPDDMVFNTHEGEEFLFLIEGKLEFRTLDRLEVLEPGDSIYFESDLSHGFRSLSGEPARAIAVIWNKH